jgi:hypothetical protein
MYLTDSEGNIDKSFTPVYDATMQGIAVKLIATGRYTGL